MDCLLNRIDSVFWSPGVSVDLGIKLESLSNTWFPLWNVTQGSVRISSAMVLAIDDGGDIVSIGRPGAIGLPSCAV